MSLTLKETLDLMSDLKEKISRYDKLELAYKIYPREGLGELKGKKLSIAKALVIQNNYPLLVTNLKILRKITPITTFASVNSISLPDFALKGDWPKGYLPLSSWFSQDSNKPWSDTLKDRFNLGCESCLTIIVSSPEQDFVGGFAIFSEQIKQDDLEDYLEKNKIADYLDLIHFYMSRKYSNLTSPSQYNGTIKPKTRKVIELTAMGFHVSEISNMLHLTERGVSYHLDLAKEVLVAKNKMELIYKATHECII
ncbi:helix-turn-helix transcriptional regulator [Shewanella livingstonensis]|uniref:Uncharacterized protein n=1 Tax=Shewanella livingstonensis TaxID=150120 RepID=A0A3G8LUN5_9GAMM|nr:hypothetical protein [Shewanella livingstonensis]AZG73289.1 hypothetical protein EGC82_11250 [Shewanella livingstonensis]